MSKEFRHIIRIADTDLDGTLKVSHALSRIKGIGMSLANAILRKVGIDPNVRLGYLPEERVKKIEEIIKSPLGHGIPSWMLNRAKSPEAGEGLHFVGSDLILRTKMDVDLMKQIKSWRGYRHAYGLKVRGQKTRTTGRAGRAVGVKKKEQPSKGK